MGGADPGDLREAARHLDAVASEPRPAGGPAEESARAHCRAELARLGFRTRDLAFEYSALPGRWATPSGGLVSAVALAIAGHAGARGDGVQALGILVGTLVAFGALALLAARRGVLGLRFLRARSVNLVAERGAPRVWLVAHLDSKSQPAPMLARVSGIVLSALAWVAALALALAQTVDLVRPSFATWGAVSAIGVLAALPVMASVVGARSPGALDDASGVATVLLAAARVPRDLPLGVLLTSAEELGLAGARAWAATTRPAVALNVDGVDDEGAMRWMLTGPRPPWLLDALRGEPGDRIAVGPLIPGLLVDAVALVDAGWTAATLSRGTLATLRRIHTPADSRERLSGAGVAMAGPLLARSAAALARELDAMDDGASDGI